MKDREREREMGRLSLKFLGMPEVEHAGKALTFPTRKALALLVYLVVEGHMHAREKLSALFWPESDAERGKATLRRTLVFLRETLDEGLEASEATHLHVERDSLGFNNTSDFELDLRAMNIALLLIHSPGKFSLQQATPGEIASPQSLLAQLQHAVVLYRGDFLDGFFLNDAPDFDDWVRAQRSYWHQQMEGVFHRLSQLQLDGGEHFGAIQTAHRWVTHSPLNELAYRQLMRVYLAAGNLSAALEAYQLCREALLSELHVGLSPETEALAERIRAKTSVVRKMPTPARKGTFAPEALEAPLTGRIDEHLALVAMYRSVQRGEARIAALTGEAGIGKTRLASDFLHWVAEQGADVLEGRAFESKGLLPYLPVTEALRRRIERENAPDDLLSDIWLAELSRLLPELRERYPDLPPPTVDEATASIRLCEAVARLGEALAARRPLVVFIDDVQWADAASLDLLSYVAGRWRENKASILLLLALRVEPGAHSVGQVDWLADLQHNLFITTLKLVPLTEEGTLKLVQSLIGPQPELVSVAASEVNMSERGRDVIRLGHWLYRESGGHPLFIMELLRALLEREVLISLPAHDQGWRVDLGIPIRDESVLRGLLPSGVRDLIHARLKDLSATAQILATSAAILGSDFTFELLTAVSGLEEMTALNGLDELLERNILQEEKHGAENCYSFSHEKIREVVYSDCVDARRRVVHLRALQVLQQSAAPPAILAHHAYQAKAWSEAFRLSLAAGDASMRIFAIQDAITSYEVAWKVLLEKEGKQVPFAQQEHLFLRLGRAYELIKLYNRARDIYEALLAHAQQAHDPSITSKALNRLAHVTAQEFFDLDAMRNLLNQAQRLAEESEDVAGQAETEWNQAQLSFYSWDPESSRLHAQRALVLSRECHAQELTARALNVLAYAERMRGRWEAARSHIKEAESLFAEQGDRAMEADCLALLADTERMCGFIEEGINSGYAARTISLGIENLWGQAHSSIELTPCLLDKGAYTEAFQIAQEGVELARRHERNPMLIFCLASSGTVYQAMQMGEMARMVHLEALELCHSIPSPAFTEMIATELCADCVVLGEWDEAYKYALQVLEVRSPAVFQVWHGVWQQTEALLRAGEKSGARENVLRYGRSLAFNRRCRIEYLRALALLAQWDGEMEQAVKYLQEALQEAETLGLPGERWQIEVALGELFQMQGAIDRAKQVFTLATEHIQMLMQQIEDPQQRASFLSGRHVQQIYE